MRDVEIMRLSINNMSLLDEQPGVLFKFSTKLPSEYAVEESDGVNVLWDMDDIQALMEGNLKKARGCVWCRTCEHYGLHGYHTDECREAFPERHRQDCKIHCVEEPPEVDESIEETDDETSGDHGDDIDVEPPTDPVSSGSVTVPTDITRLLFGLHTDVLGPVGAEFALKIRLRKDSVNLKFYRQRSIPGTVSELQQLRDKSKRDKLKGDDKVRYLKLRQEAKIKRHEFKAAAKASRKNHKAELKALKKSIKDNKSRPGDDDVELVSPSPGSRYIVSDSNIENMNSPVDRRDEVENSQDEEAYNLIYDGGSRGQSPAPLTRKERKKVKRVKSRVSKKKGKKIAVDESDVSIGEPKLVSSSNPLTTPSGKLGSVDESSLSAGDEVEEDKEYVKVDRLSCVDRLVDVPVEDESKKIHII